MVVIHSAGTQLMPGADYLYDIFRRCVAQCVSQRVLAG